MAEKTTSPNEIRAWDQYWSETAAISDHYNPGASYRVQIIHRLLEIEPNGSGYKLIEFGCGNGQFASEFCPRFPLVKFLGLDMSLEGVEHARRRVPSARFEVCDLLRQMCNFETIGFRATHAICSEVLEHVDQPEEVLRNAGSLMEPGCRLIVTVPGGPMTLFDKHIGHRKHYSPKDLALLMRSAGFEVEEVKGFGFPFYNLYRLTLLSRGSKLIEMVSGPPSLLIRSGYRIFSTLFRLNLDRWGWQTVGIARWPGR
jgi:SAM-dependent methyltransferase